MSETSFQVVTTPRFDRLARKLSRRHPGEFVGHLTEAITTLSADPYNTSGTHPIKKLTAVEEGKFRLRVRRFRFRYDIEGRTVVLLYCALRNEATYRR